MFTGVLFQQSGAVFAADGGNTEPVVTHLGIAAPPFLPRKKKQSLGQYFPFDFEREIRLCSFNHSHSHPGAEGKPQNAMQHKQLRSLWPTVFDW